MKNCSARAVALAAAALLVAIDGSAAPRVAIVVHPKSGGRELQFEAQMRSELLSSGFEVLTISEDDEPKPELLEQVARQTDSVAAVVIVQPANGVAADVWISDRVTGKTLLRHVRPEQMTAEAPGIIAIRAVELLHASLLELSEAHPSRGDTPATPSLREWAAAKSGGEIGIRVEAQAHAVSRWSLAATGNAIGGPGGLPTGFAPGLIAAWRVSSLSGEMLVIGPAMGSVSTSVGSAKFDEELFAVRVRLDERFAADRWSVFVAGGAGGYHLGARGTAVGPYISSSGDAWSALGILGLGARAGLGRSIAALASMDSFIALPRPVLRFAGTDPIYAGRPSLIGSLGLELAW